MAPEDEYQMSLNAQSDSVSEISESDDETAVAVTKPAVAIAPKDEEEEDLERLIFGSKASFREALFAQNALDKPENSLQDLTLQDAPDGQTTGLEDADDSAFFFYDETGQPGKESALAKTEAGIGAESGAKAADPNAPLWYDSDDDRLAVSLASVGRLRKLRIAEAEDVVSGTEYTRRLRQHYLRLTPLPAWATEADRPKAKRQRRMSGNEDSESGDDVDDALPLEMFLRNASALAGVSSQKKRKLRPEVIDIQRTREIPDVHKGPVGSLCFHPKYPVLLSSSISSILYLHHIAPTAHPTPNPLLTSVQVKRIAVRRSEFLQPNGDQIVFAGRRKFFQSWDISTGQVKKVTKIQGHRLEQKSMERFRLSPCGRYMAVIATDRKGGGMLNILDVHTMQWIAQARMESRGGIADFGWWSNGDGITILGRDGQVGEYSMEAKRFLGTWRDEGSIGGTVMALGGHHGPSSLGGQKWAAIGSKSGVLNIYDREDLLIPSKTGEVGVKELPEPRKRCEQLLTPVTVAAFTPDGQLLAFASQHKTDALKLVHLPSCAVYRNWPTQKTPLGRITAIAFGSGSDVLAVGNDTGKTRLWEIRA